MTVFRRVEIDLKMDQYEEAIVNKLDLKQCLIFGIKFQLAEKDLDSYPDCKLIETIKKQREMLEKIYNESDSNINISNLKQTKLKED